MNSNRQDPLDGSDPQWSVCEGFEALAPHETADPRVVGSSPRSRPRRGRQGEEMLGQSTPALDDTRAGSTDRGGDAPPRSTPRPRRLSVASSGPSGDPSGDPSDAPAAEIPASQPIYFSQSNVNWRHGAQWRGASQAAGAVCGPETLTIQDEYSCMNLGLGTQWRSTRLTTEDSREGTNANLLMAQTLERVTAHLDRLRPSEDPVIQFSGKLTEDPAAFFRELEDWLTERPSIPITRYGRILRRCVTGRAYDWVLGV